MGTSEFNAGGHPQEGETLPRILPSCFSMGLSRLLHQNLSLLLTMFQIHVYQDIYLRHHCSGFTSTLTILPRKTLLKGKNKDLEEGTYQEYKTM